MEGDNGGFSASGDMDEEVLVSDGGGDDALIAEEGGEMPSLEAELGLMLSDSIGEDEGLEVNARELSGVEGHP